jgi:hypothetical protein
VIGIGSTAMRWLLALSLAACSTTDTYDPDKERADLLRELRAAHGDANLVADGRHYMVTPEALQPEIRAFTTALAEAIESERDSRWSASASVTGLEPVIAEPWLERGLRVNSLTVLGFTTGGVTYYAIELVQGGEYVTEEVPATHAVEAAWGKLAGAAREQAAFTDMFGPMAELQTPGSRAIRGTGGAGPP